MQIEAWVDIIQQKLRLNLDCKILQKHNYSKALLIIYISGQKYLLFSDASAYVLKKLLTWNCVYKLPNCFDSKQTNVSCQEAEILAAEKNFSLNAQRNRDREKDSIKYDWFFVSVNESHRYLKQILPKHSHVYIVYKQCLHQPTILQLN